MIGIHNFFEAVRHYSTTSCDLGPYAMLVDSEKVSYFTW